MRFTIKTRADGEYSFWMPHDGGYVRLESRTKPGCLGDQICERGEFTGPAVSATPATLEAVCRRWIRQRRRKTNGK